MDQSKNERSNIVEFPVHKVSLEKIERTASRNTGKVTFALEQRKILFSASLLSILLAVSVANHGLSVSAPAVSSQARGIASFGEPVPMIRNTKWENDLIRELGESQIETDAVRGQNPSLLEDLIFGRLEGRYLLQVQDGQVLEIQRKTAGDETRAVHAFKGPEFFKNYREFFPEYDRLEKEDLDFNRFSYRLIRQGQAQAQVTVTLDSKGELLSLTVQK